MDAVSDDSYCSPAGDENTAIERSMMNLRDIEARCMRSAPMCYVSSSQYEDKSFYISCFSTAASGVASVLVGAAGSELMKPVVENYLSHISQSIYFPYAIVFGIAFIPFIGMLNATHKVIGTLFDQKAQKYNEAAAEWQELELRIKAFLAAAVKGSITAEACRQFTEECAKKRKEICLIARPDQKVYKMYASNNELPIKRLENLREFHEKRRQTRLFAC